ncbi:unnamed protein product, partial [Prorocentrum cordatum]
MIVPSRPASWDVMRSSAPTARAARHAKRQLLVIGVRVPDQASPLEVARVSGASGQADVVELIFFDLLFFLPDRAGRGGCPEAPELLAGLDAPEQEEHEHER